MSERERVLGVLRAALERGYTPEQLRQWLEGAVQFNEAKEGDGGKA